MQAQKNVDDQHACVDEWQKKKTAACEPSNLEKMLAETTFCGSFDRVIKCLYTSRQDSVWNDCTQAVAYLEDCDVALKKAKSALSVAEKYAASSSGVVADAQTKTLTITMNLDGIDLSTLDAEGFAAIEKATEDMAAAQGIDMKDVSEVIYKQNGKVVKAPTASTRKRRASGDITVEFVFKAGAVVDVDVLVEKLATAIEKNEVTFSVEIDGKKIEAKGFAAAAVDVDVKSGIVKSGASTTGIATGLIAMLATVATLL